MAPSRPRPVVLKYYLYQLADSVGFIWPIFTLFLLWNDLTYTQIGTLSAISAVLVIVFEIPTGYVADRIGRRNTLAIGMGTMAVSIGGFVVADTFLEFVALYVLWSLALALHHGTDDAWLYAALRETADESSFTRIKGHGGTVYQLGSAVTMIAGGFLYVVHPVYPFVASAALNTAGVGIVLSLPQNVKFEGKESSTPSPYRSLTLLREQLVRPQLRVFILFVALFFGVVRTTDTYIQPILIDVLTDISASDAPAVALTALPSVPEEATLGFVYAGFAVIAAAASYHADTVRNRFGLRTALLSIPLSIALLLIAPLAFPLLAIPVFFAMKGGDALAKPLVSQYLNDRIDESGRATVLSAASMSYAVIRAPMMPLVGAITDFTTPITGVAVLGGAFLATASLLLVITTPIAAESRQHTTDGRTKREV